MDILPPFGPTYPKTLSGTEKYRRAARHGMADWSRDERRAYGNAVEKAILALQRSEILRVFVSPGVNCASGTSHNTGKAIHRAVQQQQRNALLNCPARYRKARTPEQWQTMYDEAMKAKATREGKTT